MSYQNVTLERTGKPPLVFTGTVVSESLGSPGNDPAHERYHNIVIWRTKAGKWIGEVEYVTERKGEVNYYAAEAFDDPQELAAALHEYDPTGYVAGYPPLPAFKERQERLLQDIRARFEKQVSEVLDMAVFHEQVA